MSRGDWVASGWTPEFDEKHELLPPDVWGHVRKYMHTDRIAERRDMPSWPIPDIDQNMDAHDGVFHPLVRPADRTVTSQNDISHLVYEIKPYAYAAVAVGFCGRLVYDRYFGPEETKKAAEIPTPTKSEL